MHAMIKDKEFFQLFSDIPEIKEELENLFFVAKLMGYEIKINYAIAKQPYPRKEVYMCNFVSSEQNLHFDMQFINSELVESCVCRGDSKSECNSIDSGGTLKVLETFKNLL